MVTQLQESQRQMNDAIALCKIAIEENNPSVISEYSLNIEPDYKKAILILEPKEENKNITNTNGFKSDPFKSNGFASDPFENKNGSSGFATNFNNAPESGGFDDAFEDSFDHDKPDPFAASAHDPFQDKVSQAITPNVS